MIPLKIRSHATSSPAVRGAARRALAVGIALAALAACSEKPAPHDLEWKAVPMSSFSIRAGLTGVVALSDHEAVVVGFHLPEFGLLAQPVSFVRSGNTWTRVEVPGHRNEYFRLTNLARAEDGVLWACGVGLPNMDDLATARPSIFRFESGAWTEESLEELGNTSGVQLSAIAVAGRGTDFEVRAVGLSYDQAGVVIRFHAGHWSWSSLPPPGPEPGPWSLTAVGCSPWGTWYACGPRIGAPGGAAYVGDGHGWQPLAGPAFADLDLAAIGFDAEGTPWFAGSIPAGDGFEGLLFRYDGSRFVQVPVERRSTGSNRFAGLGFDVEGHGWVTGSRAPDDPFFAGNISGRWVELLAEAEEEELREGAVESGGEITSVSVLGKEMAVAVGQAEESDPEGGHEYLPRAFVLQPRPIGEIDAVTPFTPIE